MFFKKARRIQELEDQVNKLKSELFSMEQRAVEAEHFEGLCSSKLDKWVGKHDDLLIKYKQHMQTHG